jgi:hypothetical protein
MAARKNVGADLAQGGDWLFRQGELVLGPVPAAILVDKLFSGELDGRTEVAVMGNSQFRRLAEVDFFKVHLAKSEAKHRVDRLAAEHRVKTTRSRNTRIGMVVAVCVVVGAGAAAGAGYLAIHKPWADPEDAFADISVEPPTITLASRRPAEDLVDYPTDHDKTGKRVSDRIAERSKSTSSDHKTSTKPGKVGGDEQDAEGMKTEMFDKSQINGVVAARQKTLYPCLMEEAKKRPGLSAKIPIEFVIGNDGRVNKLWVDNPDFKTGTLPECLLKELQKWPFKAYQGEQATVGLQFKIGKGG